MAQQNKLVSFEVLPEFNPYRLNAIDPQLRTKLLDMLQNILVVPQQYSVDRQISAERDRLQTEAKMKDEELQYLKRNIQGQMDGVIKALEVKALEKKPQEINASTIYEWLNGMLYAGLVQKSGDNFIVDFKEEKMSVFIAVKNKEVISSEDLENFESQFEESKCDACLFVSPQTKNGIPNDGFHMPSNNIICVGGKIYIEGLRFMIECLRTLHKSSVGSEKVVDAKATIESGLKTLGKLKKELVALDKCSKRIKENIETLIEQLKM